MNVEHTDELPEILLPETMSVDEHRERTSRVVKVLETTSNELDNLNHLLAAADVEMALDRLRKTQST